MFIQGGATVMEETQLGPQAIHAFINTIQTPGASLWRGYLTFASFPSRIIALTSPLLPYNNDIIREILQSIIESLQGLNNIILSTFQKRCRILKLTTEFSFGTSMLNLECNDLIFQLLQIFYTNITSAHLDCVKTSMQKIVSLFLEGDVDICKILRSKLLTICRKEPKASPTAYDLVEKLVRKNI